MIYVWKNGEMVGECCSMREVVRVFNVSRPAIAKIINDPNLLVKQTWWFTYDKNATPPSKSKKVNLTQVEHEILTHYADKLGFKNVFELLDFIYRNATITTTEYDEQANRVEIQDIYGNDSNYVSNDDEYWLRYLCGKWHV